VAENTDDSALLLFAPPERVARRPLTGPLPGKQPTLPEDFAVAAVTAPPTTLSKERVGLAMLLQDSGTPLHRKALELARQKQHCDETLANMEGLVALLRAERTVIDAELIQLIKSATASVGLLPRTASIAQFEDELVMHNVAVAPSPSKIRRSSSQCNLESLGETAVSSNFGF